METSEAPTLPSNRDLLKKISYRSTEISNLVFDHGSNEITLSSKAKAYAKVSFTLQPKGAPSVLRQIMIGLKGHGPQCFILSERRIVGKRLEGLRGVDDQNRLFENFEEYHKNFILNIPEKPGLYEVQVGVLELIPKPVQKPGALHGFFELNSKDKETLHSKDALKVLWNQKNKIFKVSMGLIRVI